LAGYDHIALIVDYAMRFRARKPAAH